MDPDLMDPLWVRPYDLRQAWYCPRKVYHLRVACAPQRETWNMQVGTRQHDVSQAVLVGQRALEEHGLKGWRRLDSLRLESSRLGLSGITDVLFTDGETVIPLEYKSFGKSPKPGDRLQLCAYALMLEDVLSRPVPFGLWVGEDRLKAEQIFFDVRLRRRTLKEIEAVRQILQSEQLPPAPVDQRRCEACEFLNFCGDTG